MLLAKHALKQFEALGYQVGDVCHLRAFFPERGRDNGRIGNFSYPDLPTDLIEQWQSEGRGAYLVVNQGGHSDAEISQCVAVFYEHDDVSEAGRQRLQGFFPDREFEQKPVTKGGPRWYVPKDVQQQLWAALGLPEPTMQVDTGGKSIHSYWSLSESVSVAQWRELQTDLLEFADADRKLKNPSRVMRLAGAIHAQTRQPARIVGGCGKRYEFAKLRAIVPAAPPAAVVAKGITWSEFNQRWRFPVPESVPLEACLSRSNRDLLANGQQDGSRNDSGFKLATDLLAVTAFLTAEGQRFDGDPYNLFLDYCQRCATGDGWTPSEWESIWKSAQRKGRNSSLTPEQIENCVKGWAWKHCPDRQQIEVSQIGRAMPTPGQAELMEAPQDADEEVRLRLAVGNYNRALDAGNRFQAIPLRRAIAKEWGLSVGEVDDLAQYLARKDAGNLTSLADTALRVQAEIMERAQGAVSPGVPTGFHELDKLLQGGFQRGDLAVLAARPSMGKTSLMTAIARHAAESLQQPVAVFSLEMSREQIAYRLLSAETRIGSGRLRTGQITDHEWLEISEAVLRLTRPPIFISDARGISEVDIRAQCRHLQSAQGQIGMVLIDYLGLIAGASDNPVTALDRITARLKDLGGDCNVPVVVLSQLSRAVEERDDRRPTMRDLRFSGAIEQNADVVLMLYRDEYYNPDSPAAGLAELIVTKQRNGPTGTVELLFESEFARFLNKSASHPWGKHHSSTPISFPGGGEGGRGARVARPAPSEAPSRAVERPVLIQGDLDALGNPLDAPQNTAAMDDLLALVRGMIAAGDADLEMLSCLNPEEKNALWAVLTPQERKFLKSKQG